MVLFLTRILERGKVNNKQLLKILEDHENRIDALEESATNSSSSTPSNGEPSGGEPTGDG